MHSISTAALLSIVALVSSLGVVVQASYEPHKCTKWKEATKTSCDDWAKDLSMNADVLKTSVLAYNSKVNGACTNLHIGTSVRVFLLQTRIIRTGVLTHSRLVLPGHELTDRISVSQASVALMLETQVCQRSVSGDRSCTLGHTTGPLLCGGEGGGRSQIDCRVSRFYYSTAGYGLNLT